MKLYGFLGALFGIGMILAGRSTSLISGQPDYKWLIVVGISLLIVTAVALKEQRSS